MINSINLSLSIKTHADSGWYIITSPDESGLFLMGPQLSKLLNDVPSVLELLEEYKRDK